MSVLSTITSPGPWHMLSYGTLLGAQFFQSFVGGVIAFRTLARPQFAHLQQNIFPVYFSMVTALPAALFFTHPHGEGSSLALLSTSSPYFYDTTLPILVTFLTSAGNLLWVGPATTKVMKQRKHQETKEGKKYYDEGPKSSEMEKLNRSFGALHGVSSLLNLSGFVAMVVYGFTLGQKLQV